MDRLKSMLVTGGAGFIGSNFIHYINRTKPDIFILNLDSLTYAANLDNLNNLSDPLRYKFVKGDICDEKLVYGLIRDYEISIIVHFAAESHVDRSIYNPQTFIETNIIGTFSLLEAAKKAWTKDELFSLSDVRFHHISTDEVYGSLGPDELPFSENTPYKPNSPYAASKAASDHLVRSYFKTYGLPVTITNCSNNYGPYQFPEKLIPLTILSAKNGWQIPIYGDGQQIRDWLYVEDHCRGILAVLEKGRIGEVYNLGGHNEKANIDIVKIILKELGKPESLITFVTDRKGHDQRYAIDPSKAMKELGWQPTTMFKDGIKLTIDWYKKHMDWMNECTSGEYLKYYEKMYGNR